MTVEYFFYDIKIEGLVIQPATPDVLMYFLLLNFSY